MSFIKRIISWIASWFRKTPTPVVAPVVVVTPGMIAEAKLIKVMNEVGAPKPSDNAVETELGMIDYIRCVANHPDYIRKPVYRGKVKGYRLP